MKPVTLLFAVISCTTLITVDCESLIYCGDEPVVSNDASCKTQSVRELDGTYFFFGTLLDKIYVYNNATISFGDQIGKRSVPYIAALKNADLECTQSTSIQVYENIGGICSDECRIMDLLHSCGTMDCSHLTDYAVISWENLFCGTEEISIQVVLVRDSCKNETYTILLYETTGSGNIPCKYNTEDVVAEINAGGECNSCVHILPADEIFNGSHVYRIDRPENPVLISTEGEAEDKRDESNQYFNLTEFDLRFVFFGQMQQYINIYPYYGAVAFNKTRAYRRNDLYTYIAGFNANLNTVIMTYNGTTRASNNDAILLGKKNHVMTLLAGAFDDLDGFNLTDMLLVTWRNTTFFTFQIALVSDSHTNKTYALLLYDEPRTCSYDRDEDVEFGFRAGDGCYYTLPAAHIIEGGNTGKQGAYIYRVDKSVRQMHKKNLYLEYDDGPCGTDPEECLIDEELFNDQDCKHNLPNDEVLNGKYTFYNQSYHRLFVCENGLISFDYAYCPSSLDDWSASTPPLVAGFLGHVASRSPCDVTFKELTSTTDILFYETRKNIMQLINCSNDTFEPTHIFFATWKQVKSDYIATYFQTGTEDKNTTFQIALVTEAGKRDTYAVLFYNETNWDEISNKYTMVGFTAGDGRRNFTHPFSLDNTLSDLDDRSNIRPKKDGAFVYRIDGDEIIHPGEDEYCSNSGITGVKMSDQNLRLHFVDDTPLVSGKAVTAKFRMLSEPRENIGMNCTLHNKKFNNKTCDGRLAIRSCSSGFVSYTAKQTGTPYTLTVKAYNTTTNIVIEKMMAKFRIHGRYEDHVCGVNFINTGSSRELNARRDVIQFRSVGGSKYFTIEINNQNISNTSYECSPTPTPSLKPGELIICTVHLYDTSVCNEPRDDDDSYTLTVTPEPYEYTYKEVDYDICEHDVSRYDASYTFSVRC